MSKPKTYPSEPVKLPLMKRRNLSRYRAGPVAPSWRTSGTVRAGAAT